MRRTIGRRTCMSPQIPLVQVEGETSDLTLNYLEGIFSALSSVDALNIFYAAKDGNREFHPDD